MVRTVWTETRSGRATGNGGRPADEDDGGRGGVVGGRRRWPQAAVGLLLVAAGALAFVLWQLAATNRQPVLALAQDVDRGEVVEQADLSVAYVGSDRALEVVGEDDADELIGLRAAADLPAGTVASRGLFVDGPTLGADEGLVGVKVPAEAMPSPGLAVGDRVSVVHTEQAGAVITTGRVAAVTTSGRASEVVAGPTVTVVSLQVPAGDAAAVAAAAAAGQVRLVGLPAADQAGAGS